MLVYFDEIPPSGRDFAWSISTLEADADCTLDASLEARCHIESTGQGKLAIEGELRGVLTLTCDRCLVSYPFQLDSSFEVKAVVHSVDTDLQELQPPGVVESDLEDLDTVEYETPCIHLDELMRQQLLLALPQKRLCTNDCAGLCPRCGANRNEEPCECRQDAGRSPFAALAGWKAKKDKD
ncbi:MAG: DUF177 domain-containing protein [bacterium]|nr:DUF177 domain-containing protein [bacterium]